MRMNFKLIQALIKIRLSKMMTFKISFFGPLFVDASLFLIQLFMFKSIYANVDTIGGWSEVQMIIFIGTCSLVNGVNMVVFFFGLFALSQKIRTGDLDFYLTKPGNILLRISLEEMNPGSLPLIPFSIGIILYGVWKGGVSPGFGTGILYCIFVILMIVLWYDIMLLLRTFSFFTIGGDNLLVLENAGLDLCMKIPGTAFYGVYKLIFYVILPYGLIATVPTQILTGAGTMRGCIFAVVIVSLFTLGTYKFWKLGLKRYESASS